MPRAYPEVRIPRCVSQLLIITENLNVSKIPILLRKKLNFQLSLGRIAFQITIIIAIHSNSQHIPSMRCIPTDTPTHPISQFSMRCIQTPNSHSSASQLPIFASTHHSSQLLRTKVPAPQSKIPTSDIASTTHSNAKYLL